MSKYTDDHFDQQRDAAVQMQAEFEGRARRVCAYHAINFPGESNLIEAGGSGETSHGICRACKPIENDKVDALLARARAEAKDEGHDCPRCQYWRERNRPCPHSPQGREVAIGYGWAN